MTKVICDFSACEYWKDNVCQLEEIELADSCESYVLHTDVCKDHCHTFWKRVRNNEDGKAYRVESRGKRYKLLGLVWYTDTDDRHGTDTISFTEEISGLRAQGAQIREENIDKIREMIKIEPPLMSLPEGRFTEW